MCVLTICHMKLVQSTALEQKRFYLRSLSLALRNLWLLLKSESINILNTGDVQCGYKLYMYSVVCQSLKTQTIICYFNLYIVSALFLFYRVVLSSWKMQMKFFHLQAIMVANSSMLLGHPLWTH